MIEITDGQYLVGIARNPEYPEQVDVKVSLREGPDADTAVEFYIYPDAVAALAEKLLVAAIAASTEEVN